MTTAFTTLGLSEQEYREELISELIRAMRSEGGSPTIHAIAHAVARVAELDHLRMGEQLAEADVRIAGAPEPRTARGWPMD